MQQYGRPENRDVMIRVKRVGEEVGGDLSHEADRIIAHAEGRQSRRRSTRSRSAPTIVGPVVGEQLRRQGIWATVLAMAGILAYIALRFQFSFAVGAVVATLHDLLVCLAFLAFFRYDMTLNVVAGLLTITGYSVNDTIVIFDRVRENMRGMRRDNLDHDRQHRGQPDAVAHGHHRRHDAAERARALPVRRRGARGLRLHDARRHHQRHLLDGVHRLGDRDHAAGAQAAQGAGRRAAPPATRRRVRPTRPAAP